MANYVLDASVLIQRFVQDTYTPNAQAFFKQIKSNDSIFAPEFCRLECLNVLWKQVRFFGASRSQVEILISDLIALPIQFPVVTNLYQHAFRIGLIHQLAIYDSVYIAIAQSLQLPLITVDAAQTRAATQEGVTIKAITDFTP